MPNHVRNIVKMEGIADLPYFTEVDGHRCFDFNKLVAMPKDLQIEDDTLTDERIMYFITERCQIPLSRLTSEKTALLRAIFPRMYKTKLPEDKFFLRRFHQLHKSIELMPLFSRHNLLHQASLL